MVLAEPTLADGHTPAAFEVDRGGIEKDQSQFHAAIETAYNSIKNGGEVEPLDAITEVFRASLNLVLDNTTVPIIYKKGTPNQDAVIEMGTAMLQVFHENIDQTVQTAQEIVTVELPLSAKLYTDDGEPTEFLLVGIVDLLLMDENHELIVIDNKTAVQPVSQKSADENQQLSAYA